MVRAPKYTHLCPKWVFGALFCSLSAYRRTYYCFMDPHQGHYGSYCWGYWYYCGYNRHFGSGFWIHLLIFGLCLILFCGKAPFWCIVVVFFLFLCLYVCRLWILFLLFVFLKVLKGYIFVIIMAKFHIYLLFFLKIDLHKLFLHTL